MRTRDHVHGPSQAQGAWICTCVLAWVHFEPALSVLAWPLNRLQDFVVIRTCRVSTGLDLDPTPPRTDFGPPKGTSTPPLPRTSRPPTTRSTPTARGGGSGNPALWSLFGKRLYIKNAPKCPFVDKSYLWNVSLVQMYRQLARQCAWWKLVRGDHTYISTLCILLACFSFGTHAGVL